MTAHPAMANVKRTAVLDFKQSLEMQEAKSLASLIWQCLASTCMSMSSEMHALSAVDALASSVEGRARGHHL
jgi:hypothetical protein